MVTSVGHSLPWCPLLSLPPPLLLRNPFSLYHRILHLRGERGLRRPRETKRYPNTHLHNSITFAQHRKLIRGPHHHGPRLHAHDHRLVFFSFRRARRSAKDSRTICTVFRRRSRNRASSAKALASPRAAEKRVKRLVSVCLLLLSSSSALQARQNRIRSGEWQRPRQRFLSSLSRWLQAQ